MLFIGENNTIQNLAKEKPKRKITHAALAKKKHKTKRRSRFYMQRGCVTAKAFIRIR